MNAINIAVRTLAATAWIAWTPPAPAQNYRRIDLLSDGFVPTRQVDGALVNPWGLDASPTGPFWIADAGTGTALRVLGDGSVVARPLSIPDMLTGASAGSPTGVVYNGASGFVIHLGDHAAASLFLIATKEGRVFGWNPDVSDGSAVLAIDESDHGAQYEGIAVAEQNARKQLYATNFASGAVDVFDEQFAKLGSFRDELAPANFSPSGIRRFGELLFVTFAEHDAQTRTHTPAEGNGYIDVFATDGQLVRRLVSGDHLSAPWGLAMAPDGFGRFSGSLLVANTGDGTIRAYAPDTGVYRGVVEDARGEPMQIDGVRALSFGNGAFGGDARTLYFTAGVDLGHHGLFGAIERNP